MSLSGGALVSSAPTEQYMPFVLLVQFLLWQAAKPSGDGCTPWVGSVGMAGMPYPPTSVNIRVICGRLFSARRFRVFGAFRGSFFTACSVGAVLALASGKAERRQLHPLAESTEVVCKSHHITTTTSFHHLTISTPFHFEPSLLQVCPELRVRLRHHLRLVDAQPREHNSRRRERHRHAVVVVRVDWL